MAQTLTKNIRVTPEQWDRIEKVAEDRGVSANQLVVELTIDALDKQEWPRNETEIRVARAALFAAQVLGRDLIAAGREDEVEEIRQFISAMVPEPGGESRPAEFPHPQSVISPDADPGPLTPEHVGLIERTFRYCWFLATLKRDELTGEGRKAELDPLIAEAREFQAKLLKGAEK